MLHQHCVMLQQHVALLQLESCTCSLAQQPCGFCYVWKSRILTGDLHTHWFSSYMVFVVTGNPIFLLVRWSYSLEGIRILFVRYLNPAF